MSAGLFGGAEYLAQRGISYAEWARSGFFQMVGVTTVNLSVTMAALSFSRREVRSWRAVQVSRALGVDASAGTVVSASDSHGGFHRDGLTFIELSFPDDSFGTRVQTAWHFLPLSGSLNTFVYGSPGAGPYITRDGVNCFPPVQNGCYYFEDRHSQSTDPHSDSELLQRHSFNVTIAIYDADTRTFYYCEFDT